MALLLHPFLTSFHICLLCTAMELALEYQVTKWVKYWCVNPSQQPHLGSQIPTEISLLSLPRYMAEDLGKGRGRSFPDHLIFYRKIRKNIALA